MGASKQKLLIIHSSDELFGSDRILLEVVGALKDDFQLLVWLPVDQQDGKHRLFHLLVEQNIQVEHVDMPILRRSLMNLGGVGRLLRLAPRMVKLIKAAQVDQLYLMTSACLLFAPLARLAGIRMTTVHIQEPWGAREAPVLRWLARCTQRRVAITQTVIQSTGLAEDEVSVVDNAVPRLSRVKAPAPVRFSADLRQLPSYLVASRWVAHKGHETLLQAWEQAGCPGTLYVLGSAPPGPSGLDMAALVARHISKPETVKIIGQVDNPEAWFDSVDAMILPSDSVEGCGLVPIEGFRHAKPAIVSDSGGPAEVVSDGKDGWIFGLKDVAGLAQILRQCTVQELAAMGAAGKQKYEEKYTPERFRRVLQQEMSGVLLGR